LTNAVEIVDNHWNRLPQDLKDAAKRASDAINLAISVIGTFNTGYIAIRLSDGGTDGVIYETRRDAVKHQLHETQCAYVGLRNLPGGSNPKEMAVFLTWNRDAYSRGMRLPDPDDVNGGAELLMTAAANDYVASKLFGSAPRRHPNPFPNGPRRRR
jgi:hypothetical protein